MIEVEAKVSVDSWIRGDLKKIRERLKEIGKFKEGVIKVDDYYTLENLKSYPKKSLRIRKIKGKYQINFKQRISYFDGIHAKQESEFVLGNIDDFLKLIDDFGFKRWLSKRKESEIYEIKRNFHAELNNVAGLGWFLEIEYLCDDKNKIERARKDILKVLDKLSVKKKDLVKEGYTKMLWDKA